MEDGLPISIESFISLIEERPILWDKSMDNYKNKIATQNAWKEILLIMYPDFESWDEKRRQECGKKTVKKWTYIRDTFMKSEKKIEGQKMSGSGAKTTKPYVYRKQLLFLKQNIKPNILVSNIQISGATTETNEGDSADAVNDDVGASSEKSSDSWIQNTETQVQEDQTRSTTIIKLPMRKRLSTSKSPVDAKMIKFTDSYQSQVGPINRHVSFFNGLIPTLDKFNDDQVIDFQLGVIKLIKSIKNSNSTTQQQTKTQNSPSRYTRRCRTSN